ncbi:MAG: LuxR family transcriptional regulator [Sphingomonas sp. 28-62-11]|nr:MAG: LuxR family transcriptional regulator [Sphingomonas sp. 28-62-11]
MAMIDRRRALKRRTMITVVVVVLQLLATLFFLGDVVGDWRGERISAHLIIEAAVSIALLAGVVFGALQIRWLIRQARHDETAVATARGAMANLIRLRFAEWRLTAAEADVALFALKGCDIAEIAALRATAAGTVRAQLTNVYAKAGVKSQVGLIAQFTEDLVDR